MFQVMFLGDPLPIVFSTREQATEWVESICDFEIDDTRLARTDYAIKPMEPKHEMPNLH